MNKFAAFTKKFEDSICEEDSDTSCTHCNSNQDNGENYPHWPCGNTIYKYKEKRRDWLQSGWALDSVESKKQTTYNAQINVKKCFGTIQCEQCNAQTRPKTKKHGKRAEEQLDKGCPVPTCDEKPDENGFTYYLLHYGHHTHQKCLQNKPFNQEKDQLKKRISAAPETFPKKMQMGQSLDNNNPLASIRKISEAFSNTDRIAYYCLQIINEENIITKTACRHGDNFILDILQFQQDHPNLLERLILPTKV
ncbi:8042_t:CDS:2 [Entrophospora sp. SA101]|nr:8042_t:CDS:2 [Entrophospora sp. SA101]